MHRGEGGRGAAVPASPGGLGRGKTLVGRGQGGLAAARPRGSCSAGGGGAAGCGPEGTAEAAARRVGGARSGVATPLRGPAVGATPTAARGAARPAGGSASAAKALHAPGREGASSVAAKAVSAKAGATAGRGGAPRTCTKAHLGAPVTCVKRPRAAPALPLAPHTVAKGNSVAARAVHGKRTAASSATAAGGGAVGKVQCKADKAGGPASRAAGTPADATDTAAAAGMHESEQEVCVPQSSAGEAVPEAEAVPEGSSAEGDPASMEEAGEGEGEGGVGAEGEGAIGEEVAGIHAMAWDDEMHKGQGGPASSAAADAAAAAHTPCHARVQQGAGLAAGTVMSSCPRPWRGAGGAACAGASMPIAGAVWRPCCKKRV